MRTINLTTSILAPVVVGQIIHFGSQVAGAVFIAVWNLFSAVCEYHLLYLIYRVSPLLRNEEIPFIKISSPADSDQISNHPSCGSGEEVVNKTPEGQRICTGLLVNEDGSTLENNNRLFLTPGNDFEDVSLVTPVSQQKQLPDNENSPGQAQSVPMPLLLPPSSSISISTTSAIQAAVQQAQGTQNKEQEGGRNCTMGGCVAWKGWKSYFSHHVKFAGLGLACLYMTVLGFDSITTG